MLLAATIPSYDQGQEQKMKSFIRFTPDRVKFIGGNGFNTPKLIEIAGKAVEGVSKNGTSLVFKKN
jgi:hypothetical protein